MNTRLPGGGKTGKQKLAYQTKKDAGSRNLGPIVSRNSVLPYLGILYYQREVSHQPTGASSSVAKQRAIGALRHLKGVLSSHGTRRRHRRRRRRRLRAG